jgi:hypothetical protein
MYGRNQCSTHQSCRTIEVLRISVCALLRIDVTPRYIREPCSWMFERYRTQLIGLVSSPFIRCTTESAVVNSCNAGCSRDSDWTDERSGVNVKFVLCCFVEVAVICLKRHCWKKCEWLKRTAWQFASDFTTTWFVTPRSVLVSPVSISAGLCVSPKDLLLTFDFSAFGLLFMCLMNVGRYVFVSFKCRLHFNLLYLCLMGGCFSYFQLL